MQDLFMALCGALSAMVLVLFLYGMERITIQNMKIARQDKIIKQAKKEMDEARQHFLEKYTVHANMEDVLKGTRKMINIRASWEKRNRFIYDLEVGN